MKCLFTNLYRLDTKHALATNHCYRFKVSLLSHTDRQENHTIPPNLYEKAGLPPARVSNLYLASQKKLIPQTGDNNL